MRLTVIIILMAVFATSVFAERDFKYFKLKSDYQAKLVESGLAVRNVDGNKVSPIFDKLWAKIKEEGLEQVNKLTEDILKYNEDFKLGDLNKPRIDWESSVEGEFGIIVGRRVDPTLDSDNWQVRDVLEVSISASTFLKQMREGGIIDITDEKLKLFADISFSRTYTYHHFASSYKNGLTKNFSKLFLGFNYFRKSNFIDIEDGEVITKDDFLGANLKLSVSTPSMYFMSGQGKGSIYLSKLNTISYHRPLPQDRYGLNDIMRASRRTTKVTGASLQLDLQADFYSLLTITILGAEYTIDMTKSNVANMTFGTQDLKLMESDQSYKDAIVDFNRGRNPSKIGLLSEYITSSEEGSRISEQLDLYAMIWGKHIGTATEAIVFDSEHGTRYLFRHNHERTKLVKSFWDGMFRAGNMSRYNERTIENMVFEYESNGAEIDFEDVDLQLPANISFRISKEYRTKKHKSSYTKKVLALVNTFENVDGGLVVGLQDGTLKGPYTLDLHGQVGVNGLNKLIHMRMSSLKGRLIKICSSTKTPTKCFDKLLSQFLKVSPDNPLHFTVNLKNLKEFLQSVSSYAKSFKALKILFGEENVQLYGYLQSKTNSDMGFHTFFKEGDSQGLGVIKDLL